MTTLGIGGPARYFADCGSAESAAAGVTWARERGIPIFVLGDGSNVVVADSGFNGLVLRLSERHIDSDLDGGEVIVRASAGVDWTFLVAHSIERQRAGLECLAGIPGRVGATPIQNVGAYGQEISESLQSVEALDLNTGEMVLLSNAECEFGYRTSRFKAHDKGRFLIFAVTYRLRREGSPAVRYAELQRYLADGGLTHPSLREVYDAIIHLRRRKAMVIDCNDPDSRSVGSFFMNPTVTMEVAERIKSSAMRLLRDGETVPAFPASNGQIKLSAAWLIERAGISRGTVHGNVGTSTKHSLAIINRGGGTAREVRELCQIIQSRVREVFGVKLIPEPVFVGFED